MSEAVRIAIVGSGPAGLSAAARAAELKISHVLLEKTGHLSDTIFKYQKGKHVMATPAALVLRSDMPFAAGRREAVLGGWLERAKAAGVNVHYDAEVQAIEGSKGAFIIKLKNGSQVLAENVVLAIGTQGNPNLVRCPVGDGAQVQYQLDDPAEYNDEHIFVIGGGDAGIENALGLAADLAQGNVVSLVNRSADFATAKDGNVQALLAARDAGRIQLHLECTATRIDQGQIVLETRDGEVSLRCDRVIARMGSAPPRAFVEGCGIQFTGPDRLALPVLSPTFETSVPGIHAIGALAGYPLIKHCMNQGYDVVEFINGNTALKPADEPILAAKFAPLPSQRSVDDWLAMLGQNIEIFREVSPLQLRELLLDSTVRSFAPGEALFVRNDPGSSLFALAEGGVLVEVSKDDPAITVPIEQGQIVGEVGLISGRPRGATVRADGPVVAVELSRTAALKLIATVPAAGRAIARVSIERQLLQIFGSGLTREDVREVVDLAEIMQVKPGEVVLQEGDTGSDIYVIRRGSMAVEKTVGGRKVHLNYLPAGSYVGEMALLDGTPRVATVRATIRSEVIRLPGEAFAKLFERKPELKAKALADMAARRDINAFIEGRKDQFTGSVDMYSETAQFLIDNGLGEATDVLLIDETLCVGCDNCEKACADSHDGLSRLDREAGKTFAHLHVPTSCRHCEHPHCMADCPPNAIKRGPDGEVVIDETCIGCGNCQRNCPYGVIRMDAVPPKKPPLLSWLLFGAGPGPGEAGAKWRKKHGDPEAPKKAIKCDMCSGISGGPACVRACPTGAAIRVGPEKFLAVARAELDE